MSKKIQQQGSGITCPDCNGSMRVANSVPKPDENKHCRYRKCTECGLRVFTEEVIVRRIKAKTAPEPTDTKGKKKGKKLKKKKSKKK